MDQHNKPTKSVICELILYEYLKSKTALEAACMICQAKETFFLNIFFCVLLFYEFMIHISTIAQKKCINSDSFTAFTV